ncbi:MAG: hypothetical protein LBI05_01630 [Planctomycetaceae bacterium]|nr:hypothetical protein [Planctomycetaceae bacterium]
MLYKLLEADSTIESNEKKHRRLQRNKCGTNNRHDPLHAAETLGLACETCSRCGEGTAK